MPADFPPEPVRLWLQGLSDHERVMAMVIYAEQVMACGDDDAIAAVRPLIEEADRMSLALPFTGRAPAPLEVCRLRDTLGALLVAGWGNA